VASRQGIRFGCDRLRRRSGTARQPHVFHDHVDVTGLGERSNTDEVDMTMETQMRPGLDRSEVAANALVRAPIQISH
jgi:hypothetical protein